jgi:hypothetical protein
VLMNYWNVVICESVPSRHTLSRDRDSEVSQLNQIEPSSVFRHLIRGYER